MFFLWCSFVIAESSTVQPASRVSPGNNRVRLLTCRVILTLAILCKLGMVSRISAMSASAALSPQMVSRRKARKWGVVARFTSPAIGM